MSLNDVQGQTRAIDALRAALKGGNIHHAYLFSGPEGVGKELAAMGFAQALGCQVDPLNGCGECNHCARVAHRNHPDVSWIFSEDDQVARKLAGRSDFTGTPSRDIKVEQIRKLQERLALHALEGGKKVVIIASAERMNLQAQNAFLKTLEEPPPETVILLVVAALDKLLPTIRSRCAKVHFGALSADFIAEHMQRTRKLDVEKARLIGVMASGSLRNAERTSLQSLERRKEIIERFEALPPDDARPLLRYADEFGESRDEAEATLIILRLWTRDLALTKAQAGLLANSDLEPLARRVADKISDVALHRRHELIEETLVALGRNASPRLQMERLLIGLGARS